MSERDKNQEREPKVLAENELPSVAKSAQPTDKQMSVREQFAATFIAGEEPKKVIANALALYVQETTTESGSGNATVEATLQYLYGITTGENPQYSFNDLNFGHVHHEKGLPFLKALATTGTDDSWYTEKVEDPEKLEYFCIRMREMGVNIKRREGDALKGLDEKTRTQIYTKVERENMEILDHHAQNNAHADLSRITYEIGHIYYLRGNLEHSVIWFKRSADHGRDAEDTIGECIGNCKALLSQMEGKLRLAEDLVEPMERIRATMEAEVAREPSGRAIAWNNNATKHLREIAFAAEDWETVLRASDLLSKDQRIHSNLDAKWAQDLLREIQSGLQDIQKVGAEDQPERVAAILEEIEKLIKPEETEETKEPVVE